MSGRSKRRSWIILVAALVAVATAAVVLRRNQAMDLAVPSATAPSAAALQLRPQLQPEPRVVPALGEARRAGIVGTFAWGSGPTQIGLPPDDDEAGGETPLRFAADSEGNLLFLDYTNSRLLRMTPDGRVGADMKVPISNPRDLAIAKGHDRAFLGDTQITITSPNGTTRAKLPLPPGTSPRSVVISGDDVFVESKRGTLTRVGDVRGVIDPNPSTIPGRPTRDGRGYLNAIIASTARGTVHVFVIDRDSQTQRFSREISLRVLVEGIFLVDTDRAGMIYLGVTGSPAGTNANVAQLVCLEPEHGGLIGTSDLPIDVGAESALDAKALDEGGAILSIFTKSGLRIERYFCNSP